eukprot:9502857-Pyramimonas_sp.AAC.1
MYLSSVNPLELVCYDYQTAALESEWEAVTSQYQIPKADVQGSSKQVAPAAPPVRPALRPARRKTGP